MADGETLHMSPAATSGAWASHVLVSATSNATARQASATPQKIARLTPCRDLCILLSNCRRIFKCPP